jgi:RNA polymerase sigma-70 factor (ECF subfamily)
MNSDLALIKKFNKGSLEAFEELVSRYESKIMNLALRFTRNQEDAEEVVQDVFTTLYRKLQGFEGKSAFSSWLYRIVVNASFMKLRKRKQQTTLHLEDLVQERGVDKDLLLGGTRHDSIPSKRELREVLQGAIDKLPEQYRSVFILRDVDALSNEEVAEILDLSVPAVKSRLHRSRLMLRKRLARYYEELYNVQVSEETFEEENIAAQ